MENLLAPQANWGNLLLTGTGFLGIFLFLKFLEKILARTALAGRFRSALDRALGISLLFFEPAAALVLVSLFVLVKPGLHGLLVGLLVAVCFPQLRNYLGGHFARLDRNLALGKRLRTQGVVGVVAKKRRLGLQLRTDEGLHFISYSRLLQQGYTLVTGEEVGGFYHLEFAPKEMPKGTTQLPLEDLLATAPYLATSHRPEIAPVPGAPERLTAKVLVEEETHLREFLALLDERGYVAQVVNRES